MGPRLLNDPRSARRFPPMSRDESLTYPARLEPQHRGGFPGRTHQTSPTCWLRPRTSSQKPGLSRLAFVFRATLSLHGVCLSRPNPTCASRQVRAPCVFFHRLASLGNSLQLPVHGFSIPNDSGNACPTSAPPATACPDVTHLRRRLPCALPLADNQHPPRLQSRPLLAPPNPSQF